MRSVAIAFLLVSTAPAWADQVSFYQDADGLELERFSGGTINEAQELKNLNDHHPTCPCSSKHLPDATPFTSSVGKRWKVQGATAIEVEDVRPDALAGRQRQQAAKAKLQTLGLSPQDLKDALGQ